ncbi:GNAT family N-acetyltransferase [Vibrio sp. JPW-9-11-11]|uniref:GNAT family N-acetyltransferase n=1 Tax=Vibrio sp. JPW-9-11-11 TaxID=1416532 RepID=UPI0015932D45|nr:GNAT family N-acetyltransferase [Vibrio sp. JPW-9-11-11]
MDALTIESLDPIKLPLVARLYKAHYPSGKAKKDELTIAGYHHNHLAAVVRFRTVEQYRLLTGMLVVPEYRQQGVGHQLMAHCQQQVLQQGDYCFAYAHLETFYSQYGFKTLEGSALPNPLNNLFGRYSRTKSLVAMRYQTSSC